MNILPNQLHNLYDTNSPFPHITIDNFIEDDLAVECYNELKDYRFWGYDDTKYSAEAQVNKFFTPWNDDNVQDIMTYMPSVWKALSYYNSPAFLDHLEKITGISGLISDWKFQGGGCHKTERGGRLSIHTDYQKHTETQLHRRLNMLVYLNPNWKDEWGGGLQLVDFETRKVSKVVSPKFRRMILFNTTNRSLHGHPDPISCPEHEARYSFALYYFTKDRPQHEISDDIAAIWYK